MDCVLFARRGGYIEDKWVNISMRFNTTSEHFIETKFVVLKKRSLRRFLTEKISLIGERSPRKNNR
jgi:hypothetical protein